MTDCRKTPIKAEEFYRRALNGYERSLGKENKYTENYARNVTVLLEETKDKVKLKKVLRDYLHLGKEGNLDVYKQNRALFSCKATFRLLYDHILVQERLSMLLRCFAHLCLLYSDRTRRTVADTDLIHLDNCAACSASAPPPTRHCAPTLHFIMRIPKLEKHVCIRRGYH